MFDDIGLSLKKAGRIVIILSVILGIISLICCMVFLDDIVDSGIIAFLIGVVSFGFIAFPGYISSIFLYGQGETVHLLEDIRKGSVRTPSTSQKESKPSQPSAIEKLLSTQSASKEGNAAAQQADGWICPSCKKKNTAKATYCAGCYQVRPNS